MDHTYHTQKRTPVEEHRRGWWLQNSLGWLRI